MSSSVLLPQAVRRGLGIVAVTGLALTATACGSSKTTDASSTSTSTSTSVTSATSPAASGSGSAAPVSGGAAQVHITMTNSGGCTLDNTTAPAGPVTFTVSNTDATAISEVELQKDQRILGEKENLAPGLAPVSFTTTLGGGTYQIYCPGASQELQNFTVTGAAAPSATGDAAALLNQGSKDYAGFVTTNVAAMVTAVKELDQAVQSGDVAAAKTKYAAARPFYEKIESDVDGFLLPGHKATDNAGNLDYLIDMRASNLDPKVGWHGFHAVERDLWQGGRITPSTKKLSTELVHNVTLLSQLTKGITYKPEDLANGAASLLEEVQTEKIKGEEEAFSHLDLVDFNANVEGAQQAFACLKPGLTKLDPALAQSVATQFALVQKALDHYRDSSALGGFKAWTPALRATDAASLSKTVQGLQDPLSRIAQKVATAA